MYADDEEEGKERGSIPVTGRVTARRGRPGLCGPVARFLSSCLSLSETLKSPEHSNTGCLTTMSFVIFDRICLSGVFVVADPECAHADEAKLT
jgi:hypothetical protein